MIEKDCTGQEALMAVKLAVKPMTDAEWAVQRASFARGEIGVGSDRGEATYRAAAAAGDRETMARMDREAEDRVKQAFRADSVAQMAEDRVKGAFR